MRILDIKYYTPKVKLTKTKNDPTARLTKAKFLLNGTAQYLYALRVPTMAQQRKSQRLWAMLPKQGEAWIKLPNEQR
jgi:hypothetical protein